MIPYGKEVSITFDWNGPERYAPQSGDALEGKTRFYLVIGARRVNSKVHPCRLKITAIVSEDAAQADRVIPIVWSKRSEGAYHG